jgi:hypothetical protein
VLEPGLPSKGKAIGPAAKTMLTASQGGHQGTRFATSMDMALHGHVHLFEAIGFAPGGTATFMLGNRGSLNEGTLPAILPTTLHKIGPATIDSFGTRARYGFALLERVGTR